jgi:hypothetical protein
VRLDHSYGQSALYLLNNYWIALWMSRGKQTRPRESGRFPRKRPAVLRPRRQSGLERTKPIVRSKMEDLRHVTPATRLTRRAKSALFARNLIEVGFADPKMSHQ